MESISMATLNILTRIRFLKVPVRFYNSSSSECLGNTPKKVADENTPFRPRSPYAVSKATAHWQVVNYRESYGIFACNGILFNHESPLRHSRFVTKKIISSAGRIARGSKEILRLGNLDIFRDWGWAEEYVDPMWRMLQQENPEDFVISTGESRSLKDFVRESFLAFGLDWEKYVVTESQLLRPSDILKSCGNSSKAFSKLGWKAKIHFSEIILRLAAAIQEN